MLSEEAKTQITNLRAVYPERQSALLPALYVAQGEIGWLPDAAMDEVAQLLDLPPAEVGSVASFYTMFYRHPVGKNIISLCTNLSCHLLGADTLASYLSKKLGVGNGETTPDGLFTLEFVECIGACDYAPAMLVNGKLYRTMSEEKIDALLDELKAASANP
jgi:NADH-quinone oxidoreductase subunit E